MPNLQQQLALLRMEYEHEKEEFRRETELQGIARKVKRGEAWFPIEVGRVRYNSLDRQVMELQRLSTGGSEDAEEETCCFEHGRQVCFFRQLADGSLQYYDFTAPVSYVDGQTMVVEVPSDKALAELQSADDVGVQLNFDETTYQLMFEALRKVIGAKNGRLADLREIFHGGAPVRWGTPPQVPLSLPWLNASQQEAVRDVLLAKDVLVVHGPPGTGKTTTLVEAIDEVLRREAQVMVCAQSNTAVDWISQQLADRGLQVLRVGNPTRVTDDMLACTYERRFEAHPDYPQLWQIRRTIRQLRSQPRKGRSDGYHQKMARLRERADELEIRIRQSLFDGCRVVACTLAGSANQVLMGQRFHTLFIDEAAQALEAACWIALQKCHRVILAGDHQQLPPTIKCHEALRQGLGRTLMEQIAQQRPDCVRLLTVQYRMNETLMRFSSEWFYEGRLTAAPEVSQRSLLSLMDDPLVWVESEGAEEFVGANYGRINKAEAELTLQALRDYCERLGMQRIREERVDFGIISPYRAQVQYLRHLLKRDDMLKQLRRQITVNTVDAFQGQERDVICVSLVRANEQGQIGFLADLRRMNVAMTRARMKLIILGDSATLTKHKFYKALYEYCVMRNE
ncbi:MAG: AAA domain-containing protein [Bacteroidaceae bacterium]|nr:AAA domain-containing protein [Bacteroidaceae bacterium]